jgi:transposase
MKAYSVDLRHRIVAAVRGGMSKAEAARTFRVGATSVKRYVARAQQGESLEPGKAPGKQSKLGHGSVKLLEEDLQTRPAATYENRAELLHELLGVRVSRATICRTIRRMGYTRKKDRWMLLRETSSEGLPGE